MTGTKKVAIGILSLLTLIISHSLSYSETLNPSTYYSIPPFLQQKTYSNIMLVLDYSGSMKFKAYNYKGNKFDGKKTYYGYFKPDKKYCKEKKSKSISIYSYCPNGESGNKLNYEYMRRIDILRLILTGGKVVEYNNKEYLETISKNGTILIPIEETSSYNTETGEVEGILQQIARNNLKPRIGLVIFPGKRHHYRHPNSYYYEPVREWIYPSYNYDKLIEQINNTVPAGRTPTGEALDEVYHYFSLKDGIWRKRFSRKDSDYVNPYEFNNIKVRCAKNFVVLISDGGWNGHWFSNEKLTCDNDSHLMKNPINASIYKYSCIIDPSLITYKLWTEDLSEELEGKQRVETYAIYSFSDTPSDKNALENTAIYGSFIDKDGDDLPYGYDSVPPSPPCDSKHEKNSYCGSYSPIKKDKIGEWDKDKNGIPDNFFYGDNPQKLKEAIYKIFKLILKKVFSATSVCALSEKGNIGSISLQALFYPERYFDDKKVGWIGYLYSWWLYNSKSYQNIREDTNENKILDISTDHIVEWSVNEDTGKLKINVYNSTSTGNKGSFITSYDSFDSLHPLWEAGSILLNTAPQDRKIFTTDGNRLIEFTKENAESFKNYLGNPGTFPSCLSGSAGNLVSYIRGKDIQGCRNRSVDGETWKLGDIIYSTPTAVDYGKFSVVFVGANDGMLHAFKVGFVKKLSTPNQVAKIQNSKDDNGSYSLGEELWAFIPKNALPYLRYLANPDYKHMYFVDLKPYVYSYKDAKGNLHRILIGGMRLGGAVGCTSNGCINPPTDTCPDTSSNSCVGLSSYFALDITNPLKPKFLWEFTNKDLGFTYSGPAIVKRKNGTYVIFGSGPDNYKGEAYTNLNFFVLNLFNGNLERVIDTGIQNAFSGRLFTEGIDFNNDGYTDSIFVGTSIFDGDLNNMKGGILQIDTNSDNINDWRIREYLIREIPPVTSKVEVMKCFNRWYIYFGTGKWFFKEDNPLPNTRERIYGLPLKKEGKNWVVITNAADVSEGTDNICNDLSNGVLRGWYIELSNNTGNYLKERSIADPTPSKSNVIFFTTIQPSSDPCSFGGRTRVWGLNCATGGSLFKGCLGSEGKEVYAPSTINGSLLLQLSSGDIEQIIPNKSYFSNNGNRTTKWYIGISPESSTPLVVPETWLGELLLWIEK